MPSKLNTKRFFAAPSDRRGWQPGVARLYFRTNSFCEFSKET